MDYVKLGPAEGRSGNRIQSEQAETRKKGDVLQGRGLFYRWPRLSKGKHSTHLSMACRETKRVHKQVSIAWNNVSTTFQ
jgi:hypothetical protein